MSFEGARRKFDVAAYTRRWPAAALDGREMKG
jgi:hypothetical protein